MVELHKKYHVGVRRFSINWVGAYTLYLKETLRFLSVFGQTIIGPIVFMHSMEFRNRHNYTTLYC